MAAPTEPSLDNQDQEQGEELQGQMSFFDHLEELRKRLLNIVIVLALGFAGSWYSKDGLFLILTEPISKINDENGKPLNLVAHSLTSAFNLSVEVCFFSAILIGAPFIIREIWQFVGPALYKRERRYALPFVLSAWVLFMTGTAFGYFVAFPLAASFLIEFTKSMGMVPLIQAGEYFDLFLIFEVTLGVVFEIPAVIFILSRIGIVSAGFLVKNFQYAVLLTAIISAVATPTTDIPNMMMIAVPMLGLYIVGIAVAYIFGKKKPKDDE